tara:strand:+ start:1954 stop:2499 length:546 start_codon:yes stop_codon:yes gene_type:complete
MVWKYKEQEIAFGVAWKDDDGTTHPADWVKWSDDDKKKMGLVWEDDPEPWNDRFYSGRNADGTLIEKKLEDENALDSEGKEYNDIYGNKAVNIGLKNEWIAKIKARANQILKKTDWYALRKAEAGTAIPSDIATFRAKIRTESKAIEDKINACSSLADFQALFDAPESGGQAPIFNFSESP